MKIGWKFLKSLVGMGTEVKRSPNQVVLTLNLATLRQYASELCWSVDEVDGKVADFVKATKRLPVSSAEILDFTIKPWLFRAKFAK